MVRVRRILRPDAVEDILYRVDQVARRMSGSLPLWSARLDMSGYGTRLFGSNATILKKPDDPDATFFVASTWDSTGVWTTYAGLLDRLRAMLENYADLPGTVVYLHSILLQNFEYRRAR